MSTFLNRAMQNVDKKPEKPNVATIAHSHTPVFPEMGEMKTDFDLANFAGEELQEQLFLSVVAPYMNLAQGQNDAGSRAKVRNKVAATFKKIFSKTIDDVYQSLRKLDPELEQELAKHLSTNDDENPL